MSLGWSSGQMLREHARTETCPKCLYRGVVDAWFDPEVMSGGWECPACGVQYIVERGNE